MFCHKFRVAVAALFAGIASAAWAGPWTEIGDAGNLLTNAQQPVGSGPLTSISGHYGFTDVDLYRIYIGANGPVNTFSAIGDSWGGLFLFSEQGLGVYKVLAYNIAAISNVEAYYPDFAPGIYYLGVASYGQEPYSLQDPYNASSIFKTFAGPGPMGATGPGHSDPLWAWGGGAYVDYYDYNIRLNNASFIEPLTVPEPASIGLVALGMGLLALRRRHDRNRPGCQEEVAVTH